MSWKTGASAFTQGFLEGYSNYQSNKATKADAALEEELARMKMDLLTEELGLDREKFEWDKAQDEMDSTLDMAKLRKSLEGLKGGGGIPAKSGSAAGDNINAMKETIPNLITDNNTISPTARDQFLPALNEAYARIAGGTATEDDWALVRASREKMSEDAPSWFADLDTVRGAKGKEAKKVPTEKFGGGKASGYVKETPTVNKEEQPKEKPSPEEAEKFLRNRFPYKTTPEEIRFELKGMGFTDKEIEESFDI